MKKKIYSTNLAAFIYMVSHIEPITQVDYNGTVYFLYDETPEMTLLINMYKNNHVSVDLKQYINCFRYIRSLMKRTRG